MMTIEHDSISRNDKGEWNGKEIAFPFSINPPSFKSSALVIKVPPCHALTACQRGVRVSGITKQLTEIRG